MAINTNPDQYVLGKGRFYFAQRQTDGTVGAFRFIGNCPAFSLTPSSDNLTHVSSTGGINVTDRDIQTSSDLAIGFTTDNMSDENKALWMGGTVDVQTIASATAQTYAVPAGSVKKGYAVPIVTALVPAGLKDITVTQIVQGGTPLVAGTDYAVNSRNGLITFLTTGAVIEGTSVTVTYSVAAATRNVKNNRGQTITGAVKFISDNPDTGNGKIDEEHFLPYVRISPDGDWGLIGSDWQSFGFTGTVLQSYDAAQNAIPRHTITPLT